MVILCDPRGCRSLSRVAGSAGLVQQQCVLRLPFVQRFEGPDRPFETVKPAGQPDTLLLGAKNRRIFNRMVTTFAVARGCKDYQATM